MIIGSTPSNPYNERRQALNKPLKRKVFCATLQLMVLFFAVPHARAYDVPEVHTVSQYHFNVPPGLESKVNFWRKIYTEYTTEYVVIHDLSDLDIIYEVVYFGDQPSRAAKERTVENVKSRYRQKLANVSAQRTVIYIHLNLFIRTMRCRGQQVFWHLFSRHVR